MHHPYIQLLLNSIYINKKIRERLNAADNKRTGKRKKTA